MAFDSYRVKSLVAATLLASSSVWPSPSRAQSDCFAVTQELRAQGRPSTAADSTDCWYTVHVHAVRVTDFCPADRATAINSVQVARWVEKANEVYAAARVRFEFDPTPGIGDWAEWNETDINDLVEARPGDPVWERGKAAANEMASHYPGKVLVLFRHGPGEAPVGGGFSSNQYDFVVMPAFRATTICGDVQNAFLFAHELGHYLGLKHTFRQYATTAAAVAALKRANLDPGIFDGDGIEDTAPDPYIEDLQCGAARSVVLNGVPFLLLRDNVMSYYYSETKTVTPQQAAVVRATIERRFAHVRDDTGPYMPDPRRTYQLLSLEDGKVLDAGPASAEAASIVGRGHWTGAASQEWRMVPLAAQDAGWFEIVSPVSGKCLAVDVASAPDGAVLGLAAWGGSDNQKWRLAQDERGDFVIEAKHSRRVLTVPAGPAGTVARDGRVRLATDTGGRNQRWRLLPGR